MSFTSFRYLLCLPAAAVLFFCLPNRFRLGFLWIVSMAFAFLWSWQTGALLLAEITIAYWFAAYIQQETDAVRRKWAVAAASFLLLAGLGIFKYADFFLDSCGILSGICGDAAGGPHHIALFLPVGISFYSFMCLGYVVAVYRGKCSAEKNWFRLGVFAGFFPQFAAGPIGTAPELLPQFRQEHHFLPDNLAIGFRLILWGLFKKVVIADRLARFADPVFAMPGNYSGMTALVATYFFTIQIYCDFSGYSDIAIGSAKLFGINLMRNFKQPYFADSIYEFWKRWHISLTTWFRDNLYISLGGNRVGFWRWQGNIFLVFLISGLWHGAAWTFVIWGALHGALYLMEQRLKKWFGPLSGGRVWACLRPLRILLTFHLAAFAWIFFRAPSYAKALEFFARFRHWGVLQWGASRIPTAISFGLIAFLFGAELLIAAGWSGDYLERGRCPGWLRCCGYAGLLIGIALLGVSGDRFIYLQF